MVKMRLKYTLVATNFKCLKFSRCVQRLLLLGLTMIVAIVLIPSVRNTLLPVPPAWHPLSTLQLLKVLKIFTMDTTSGSMVYLSPCLDPQSQFSLPTRTGSSHRFKQDNRGPVPNKQNSHRSDTRSQVDVELYARAKKWVNSSAERNRTFSPYLPLLNIADKARLLDTWRVFHEVCHQHGIPYFLMEGTLLGAFRHKGIIPWDDDIDVGVDIQDLDQLKRALSCMPGYTLRIGNNMHWKFFAQDASVVPVDPAPITFYSKTFSLARERAEYTPRMEPSRNVVMRFPFIDIFITASFGGFIGALTNYVLPTFYFPSEIIYPLTVASFEGYLVPVPRNSLVLLKTLYGFNVCMSPFHKHRLSLSIHDISQVPCKDLAEMYPIYNV